MGKYGEIMVEMQKIIKWNPLDTFWVYWETDIYYNIIGSTEQIMVRTPDKTLTNSEATLIGTFSIVDIPIGTYSVDGGYDLIVGTVGYITDVYYGTYSVDTYTQRKVPKDSETLIEWITTENKLYPFVNSIRPKGYGVGATYSTLVRTDDNINLYWLTDEYGNVLTDDNGDILTSK
tara:strand:- start:1782 stop:2309 length:528 start_codon:yes stop_codon:yes gene_type:complete